MAATEVSDGSRSNLIMKMLQKIALKEGIVNPKIDITKGCGKGEGYLGEKSIAIVKGDKKSLQLFIKAAPTDPAFKKAMDARPIYLQEILLYRDIYPTFNEFQTRKNIPKPFTSVIGCVDTCSDEGNELLILQNARNLGFELWDRQKQMNPDHVEFVYREYAKYHALSYALKDQEPKVYQSLIDSMTIDAYEFVEDNFLKACIGMHETAKAQLDPIKDVNIYMAYSKFIEDIPIFIQKLIHEKNKFSIITHGDCWCTNMMFKYPENSDKSCPEKMCFLDFQAIAQGTPVMDLSYFLYASAPKEVYNNLDHNLKIYHASLSKTVNDLGSPQSAFPTYKDLKNLWKVYGRYGLCVSVMVLKICLQETDETQDISEALEENGGTDMMAGFSKESKNDALYYERFKDLIVHAVENEII